jgi:hypothetical protein
MFKPNRSTRTAVVAALALTVGGLATAGTASAAPAPVKVRTTQAVHVDRHARTVAPVKKRTEPAKKSATPAKKGYAQPVTSITKKSANPLEWLRKVRLIGSAKKS